MLQGEKNVGDNTADSGDTDADRCNPGLAPQQGMGLRSQWRVGIDIDHPDHPAVAGTDIAR